jgi:hypothetical protein
LEIEVNVEGVVVVLSHHISMVPCLADELAPGDSLLNDNRIREALKMALDSSPPSGDPWNRRERGGVRMLQTNGTLQDVLLPVKDVDTPCSFEFTGALSGLPGAPAVAWHSHPFRPGDPSDPLPYDATRSPPSNCPQLADLPSPPEGKVYSAGPGASKKDLQQMEQPPMHLIVDPSKVLLYDHGRKREFKKTTSCDPLAWYS